MSDTVPFKKAKSVLDSCSANSPTPCKSKNKSLGTHNTVETVGYGTTMQMSHSRASVDQTLLSITHAAGPGTLRLDYG
ncbi:hypothetical protein TNCV_4380621 [Trichonephila clavipes]|nr:hypothetical protein TNCV_4380621 [Trichonephila clavipes]